MAFLIVLLAVPLAGLGLLLARPELDVRWEHHPAHFWLVLAVGVVNVVLGLLTSDAAQGAIGAIVIGWAAVSLSGLPPLDDPLSAEEASRPLQLVAAAGSGCTQSPPRATRASTATAARRCSSQSSTRSSSSPRRWSRSGSAGAGARRGGSGTS